MTTITRGPHRPLLEISSRERELFDLMYRKEGAWTLAKGEQKLGPDRLREVMYLKLVGVAPTELGPLLVLLSHGRIAAYGVAGKSVSLERHINQAYRRLAMQELDWHFPQPGEPTRNLEQFDPIGCFREVRTQYGLALVAAKLTGNGYSSTYINMLSTRLRSQALYENFYVIILTPSRLKGKQHAAQFEAFLKVITVRPDLPLSSFSPDVLTPIQAEPTPAEPYLAGSGWRDVPRFQMMPSGVLRTLQMPRDQRVEQAMLSIECDGVMSAAQLKSFYALNPEDLPEVHRRMALLRTTPSQRTSETLVEFLTLSRRLVKHSNHSLAHRCGTGRIRHVIDIPPEITGWKAEHRGRLRLKEPDAVRFEKDGTEWAAEFDNGTYSMNTIERKLSVFKDRGFDKVIWGVSNPLRQRSLTKSIGDQLDREILLAEWWK